MTNRIPDTYFFSTVNYPNLGGDVSHATSKCVYIISDLLRFVALLRTSTNASLIELGILREKSKKIGKARKLSNDFECLPENAGCIPLAVVIITTADSTAM